MSTVVEIDDVAGKGTARTADVSAAIPLTVIQPPSGWQMINLRELWQFRELIYFLAWRNVKVRYKQTVLGAAWAILQPLMMMAVFSIFFGRMANAPSGDFPYPLFVLAGLLPWFFFSTGLTSAANSVVGSERLITKIYFPRLAIPFAATAVALVDFLAALGLLTLMMLGYAMFGTPLEVGPKLLLVPIIMAAMFMASLGVGTFFAALNVAYRDFRYVVPFLVQLGMFATPTLYMQPKGTEGRLFDLLMLFNPMTSLIASFRASVLGGHVPWAGLAVGCTLAVALFVAGSLYFRRVEDNFADII